MSPKLSVAGDLFSTLPGRNVLHRHGTVAAKLSPKLVCIWWKNQYPARKWTEMRTTMLGDESNEMMKW